ncbi:MAG: hypothetical protein MZV65_18805 [Chromatiales bacterium]|nr:hypothetical protein [Chromatiales bacterium]
MDADYQLISANLKRLFPGVQKVRRLDEQGQEIEEGKAVEGVKQSGPQKLALLLADTEKTVLEAKEVAELTGIKSDNIVRSLDAPAVKPTVEARKWRKATRKEAGLSGKGWILMRDAAYVLYENPACYTDFSPRGEEARCRDVTSSRMKPGS